MSEPVARQRSSIDLADFEKSLRDMARAPRSAGHGGQEDDPLAELARLVGSQDDPYRDVFAREALPLQQAAPTPHDVGHGRGLPDFAAIEAGLRGTIPVHAGLPQAHPGAYGQLGHPEAGPHPQAGYDYAPEVQDDPAWYGSEAVAPSPAPRSRRPIYAMASVIVIGLLGIGVAFAFKGSGSSPREIATIKAVPGPTKIQPPADANAQSTQDASILDKGQQPTPTKLVSREEQPVDLSQAVQSAPRGAFGSASDASSVPVPSPPGLGGQTTRTALGEIEPIRVKTRSYRPDGTPILDDEPPAAALPPPTPVAKADPMPVAKPSTPRATTTKSTARATTTPKAAPPATIADAAAPVDLTGTAATKKVKPAKIAAAKTAAAKPADTTPGDTKPTEVASLPDDAGATEAARPVAGAGGFAVQVAAPGSEAEAKQLTIRLTQKYSGELSGHRLAYHKAESNGRSIYRVRVGALSRGDAVDLCEKLKAGGGTCFVAKN